MKAVISTGKGIEKLVVRELPDPPPPAGHDVQIRVHTFGLNWRDVFKVRGNSPWCRENPIPGSDAAGEVIAVGDQVTRFKVGDKVITSDYAGWYDGLLTPEKEARGLDLCFGVDGCMRELFTMHENGFVRMPAHLSWEEAGGISTTFGTAFNGVVNQAGIRLGESLLIEGTGGLSTAAISFAKASGARVIVTGIVKSGLDRAKELGADETIDINTYPDWDERVLELTGGLGVDASIDILGLRGIDKCMASTKQNGTMVMMANLTGAAGTFNMALPLKRQLTIKGFRVASTAMMEQMVRGMELYRIPAPVDSVFDLDHVQDAFRRLTAGVEFGKVIVKLN